MKGKLYAVAVAGATGAVGLEMIKTLEQRKFPVGSIKLLASERSAGKELRFNGKSGKGGEAHQRFLQGNSDCPFLGRRLPQPGVCPRRRSFRRGGRGQQQRLPHGPGNPAGRARSQPHAIAQYKKRGIIANPNCSTIQMVVALKPIHDAARIKRIVVSTYQAVSGTGLKAIDELLAQTRAILNSQEVQKKVYPHQIAFNCLPHIDVFLENGYTKEEMKMVNETRKIMEDPTIRVTATTVRVPVLHSHSESVNIETEKKLTRPEGKGNPLPRARGEGRRQPGPE